MDSAQADDLYTTVGANAMGQRVGGRGDCEAALDVSLSETVSSADLGGSSKYSNENFERPKWRKVPCEQQLDMG